MWQRSSRGDSIRGGQTAFLLLVITALHPLRHSGQLPGEVTATDRLETGAEEEAELLV